MALQKGSVFCFNSNFKENTTSINYEIDLYCQYCYLINIYLTIFDLFPPTRFCQLLHSTTHHDCMELSLNNLINLSYSYQHYNRFIVKENLSQLIYNMYRRLISMWFKSSHLYYCIKNKNNKRFAKTEIKKKKVEILC